MNEALKSKFIQYKPVRMFILLRPCVAISSTLVFSEWWHAQTDPINRPQVLMLGYQMILKC